jgi:uncharacterized protein with HEPN domain
MTVHFSPRTSFVQSLYDMHEASAAAMALVQGRSSRQIFSDKRILVALLKAVEIADAAATSVEVSRRTQYPDIPWEYVIGFYQEIVNSDGNIDLDALWFYVTDVLSPLLFSLEQVIEPRLHI